MMTIMRLHELFDENPGQDAMGFEGNCHDCGKELRVTVTLAADGFVIRGGAVYEPEPKRFYTKCEACFQQNPQLSGYRQCEVYSRVVGYLRPVAQWNEGKQAEFAARKTFRV